MNAPDIQLASKNAGERFEEVTGLHLSRAPCRHTGGGTIWKLWMMGNVEAHANDDGIAIAFQQHTAKLGVVDKKIIGPFNSDLPRLQKKAYRFLHRYGSDQGKCAGRWIIGAQANDGRAVKIAFRAFPAARQAAPPARLLLRAQPEAFRRPLPRQQQEVGVGGAGFGNGADIAGQKSACAAAAVALSSMGFKR